jgi:hypothetical protein
MHSLTIKKKWTGKQKKERKKKTPSKETEELDRSSVQVQVGPVV